MSTHASSISFARDLALFLPSIGYQIKNTSYLPFPVAFSFQRLAEGEGHDRSDPDLYPIGQKCQWPGDPTGGSLLKQGRSCWDLTLIPVDSDAESGLLLSELNCSAAAGVRIGRKDIILERVQTG